jgi:hypothetical protein
VAKVQHEKGVYSEKFIPIRVSVDIINPECTQEMLEYIFDCWTTFVTQDLGWEARDAIMVQEETVTI